MPVGHFRCRIKLKHRGVSETPQSNSLIACWISCLQGATVTPRFCSAIYDNRNSSTPLRNASQLHSSLAYSDLQ